MSKLGTLLHVGFIDSFGLNVLKYTKDPDLKRKHRNQISMMLLAFFSIVFVSFFYSVQMIESFEQFKAEHLLLAMLMVSSSLLTFMTMVHKSSVSLFSFSDYDSIMSLPIKTSVIVVSRIIGLYVGSLLVSVILMLPAGFVYAFVVRPDFLFYPIFIITVLFVPLIPIIVGAIAGLIITLISSYFKKTNFVKIVVSIVFILAIMAFSFMNDGKSVNYYGIIEPIMNSLSSKYPIVTYYVDSLVKFDLSALGLFLGISIILFSIFTVIVTKFYKSINTFVTTKRTASNYKVAKMKTVSARSAVVKKELRRFFTSANYFLNAGIGIILSTAAAICLLLFNAKDIEAFMNIPGFAGMISSYAPIVLSLFVGMSTTTAASISLEGKSFWVLKTIPVKTKDILMAKLLVTLILGGCAVLINGTLFIIALKPGLTEALMMYIVPLLFVFFMGCIGLIANLKSPKFDWTNEISVIKQSVPAFITVMVGMALPLIAMSILQSTSIDNWKALIVAAVVLFLGDLYLYKYINTKGVEIFNKM